MVNGALPNGWVLKSIDELYEVIGGGTPSTSIPEYWNGNIPWITSADIAGLKDIQPRKKITKDAIANSATSLVPAGSLIVVTRVSLGKVALTSYPLCFSQDSQALISKDNSVLPQYALYYLAQATQIFKYQSRGTTISGVTKKQLKELPFPLPPLPEQERIVAKIEELFTQLEAGTSAVERVQVGLRRYKASVLKAAVSGRLVNGNLEIEEGKLPEGWRWARAEDICEFITKGTTPKANKLFSGSGDVPFIKVYNLTFDGTLDFSVNPTFVSKETHAGELARSKVYPGDVLMNIVGPPLGKVSIAPDTFPEWNMNQAVARFRPLEFCDRKYLSIALRTEDVLSWAVKRAKATAGQFNLTLEICRDLPIPLPPLEEQRRIVAEVERRLSVAREVESVVEKALARSARLRQAVLKSAFKGKLT